MAQGFCYNSECPVRTKGKPWPRSDWKFRYKKVISKNGKEYYRRLPLCEHCNESVTFVTFVQSEPWW